MNFKILILFLLLLFLKLQSIAQDYKEDTSIKDNSFRNRIFTGGGVGLSFGRGIYINLSPLVGYRITNRFSTGLGLIYMYLKSDNPSNSFYSETHIYGGKIFSRYTILPNLFAHTEYEALNLSMYDYTINSFTRRWVGSLLVGGGYRQILGGFSSFDILLLYNLNQTIYSPYPSPFIIRGGITIGI